MTNPFLLLIVVVGLIVAFALWRARQVTVVYPPTVGLLYRDGRFVKELGPGRYTHVDPLRRTRVIKVSRAALPVPLGDFTVVSRDQFSFRVALSPIVEVVDAQAFTESQPSVEPTPFSQFMPPVASHAALHSLAASAAMGV